MENQTYKCGLSMIAEALGEMIRRGDRIMPFTLPEALADFPELLALVQSIVNVVPQIKAAKSFSDRQKLSEPIQEALAKLVDEVVAQAAS